MNVIRVIDVRTPPPCISSNRKRSAIGGLWKNHRCAHRSVADGVTFIRTRCVAEAKRLYLDFMRSQTVVMRTMLHFPDRCQTVERTTETTTWLD